MTRSLTMWLHCWAGSPLMGPFPGHVSKGGCSCFGLFLRRERDPMGPLGAVETSSLRQPKKVTRGRKDRDEAEEVDFSSSRHPLARSRNVLYAQCGSGTGSCQRELPQKRLQGDPCVSIGGNGKYGRGSARGHIQSAALR